MKTKKESGEKKIEPQVLDPIKWDCACEGRFRFNPEKYNKPEQVLRHNAICRHTKHKARKNWQLDCEICVRDGIKYICHDCKKEFILVVRPDIEPDYKDALCNKCFRKLIERTH